MQNGRAGRKALLEVMKVILTCKSLRTIEGIAVFFFGIISFLSSAGF
jgi:hypothetical protein